MLVKVIEINGSLHTGMLSTPQMFMWLVVLLFDIGILKVNILSKLSRTLLLTFPLRSQVLMFSAAVLWSPVTSLLPFTIKDSKLG